MPSSTKPILRNAPLPRPFSTATSLQPIHADHLEREIKHQLRA
jgi:hypothetical protein